MGLAVGLGRTVARGGSDEGSALDGAGLEGAGVEDERAGVRIGGDVAGAAVSVVAGVVGGPDRWDWRSSNAAPITVTTMMLASREIITPTRVRLRGGGGGAGQGVQPPDGSGADTPQARSE